MSWKFKIIWLLSFAFIVSAMAWHVITLQSNIVKMAGIHNAKLYSDAITAFRTLYTSEIVRIAGEHDLEITHVDPTKDNSIPLPATFSTLLGKRIAEAGSGASVKLYSPYPFPWRQDSGGLQDAFNQEAWSALTEKPTVPFYKFEKQDNRNILRYAVADRMRAGCTDCHNQHPNTSKTGWKTGDVAGVLEINLPLDSIIAASRSDIKGTIAIYGFLALIAAIGIFMIIMKEKRYSMKLEQEVKDRTIEFEYQKVRAENATRIKSEFLDSMSHEIRTPMSVVLGMAEVLKETKVSPEQKKNLNILNRAGNTLLRVIDDILDLSKVEAGHVELENIEFELENELAEIESAMGVIARQNNLKLSYHVEPDVPAKIIGDPKRLIQILFYIVSNAVKFTKKGQIDINVRKLGVKDNVVELEFYVRDTGIGIPEDKQGIIFDGFTQLDSSTTRDFAGTGLGITISKKLIELMGGRIWVESKLGEGSTFYYTVKLKVAETEGDE